MCGRYYIDPEDNIEELLAIPIAASGMEAKRYGEIRPADTALVLANNRNKQQRLFPMKWGFPRPDGKLLMINARSETAQEKAAFADSAKNRRCIIPASGYYEWGKKDKETGKKQKYAFSQPGSRLIYMAGLYMVEEETHTPYYTILTRDAVPEIAEIHGRMPVVLPENLLADWLSSLIPYEGIVQFVPQNVKYEKADRAYAHKIAQR